jgi:hypothetical protein
MNFFNLILFVFVSSISSANASSPLPAEKILEKIIYLGNSIVQSDQTPDAEQLLLKSFAEASESFKFDTYTDQENGSSQMLLLQMLKVGEKIQTHSDLCEDGVEYSAEDLLSQMYQIGEKAIGNDFVLPDSEDPELLKSRILATHLFRQLFQLGDDYLNQGIKSNETEEDQRAYDLLIKMHIAGRNADKRLAVAESSCNKRADIMGIQSVLNHHDVASPILESTLTNVQSSEPAVQAVGTLRKYVCKVPTCGKRFAAPSILTVHERTHTGERPYVCDARACRKGFTTAGNLKLHKRTHTGEKLYVCDVHACGKEFTRSSSLKRHKRTHTGERPYACDVPACGTGFTTLGNLTRHKRTHTGEKPYVCDVPECGKGFTTSSNLTMHKRTHTGEKPYVCDVPACGKRFMRLGVLTEHKRTHTGEKPYVCDVPECGKRFTQSGQLTMHKAKSHRVKRGNEDPSTSP